MAARRVFTEDEVDDLIARALKKSKSPPRPDFDRVKEQQDQKILAKELAREKRHRVLEARTADEQLDALGGPMAVTPHQLVKLRSTPFISPRRQIEAGQSEVGPSIVDMVLGDSPKSEHLARLREVQRNLHGKGVSVTPSGEIDIGGDVIAGSDMVRALKFIVRGSRGVRKRPPGVEELARLLRGSVSSSKFPPVMRPFLGGKQPKKKSPSKRSGAKYYTPPSTRGAFSSQLDNEVEHDEDQEGSGLDLARAQLNAACDHAQAGEFDEAWEALEDARSRGATNEQVRKAATYIHSC